MVVNVNECDVKEYYYRHHTSSHEGECDEDREREEYEGYVQIINRGRGEDQKHKPDQGGGAGTETKTHGGYTQPSAERQRASGVVGYPMSLSLRDSEAVGER